MQCGGRDGNGNEDSWPDDGPSYQHADRGAQGCAGDRHPADRGWRWPCVWIAQFLLMNKCSRILRSPQRSPNVPPTSSCATGWKASPTKTWGATKCKCSVARVLCQGNAGCLIIELAEGRRRGYNTGNGRNSQAAAFAFRSRYPLADHD